MPAQPGPRSDQLAQRNAVLGDVLTAGAVAAPDPLAVPSYQLSTKSLDDLTDVDAGGTQAPDVGDILTFDGINWVPATSGIAFFGSGDTQAQVQAALDDPTIQIVYIKSGATILCTTTLTVPVGKTLSGTANKNRNGGLGQPFDLVFTGSSAITAQDANLLDLAIKRTNDWLIATGFIDVGGIPGGRIQGCAIEIDGTAFGAGKQVIRSANGAGGSIRDIFIRMLGSANPQGIHVSSDPSFNRSVLSGITMISINGGVTQHGIILAGGNWGIENCSVSGFGGDGYNLDFSTNNGFSYVRNCEADNCKVNGFNVVTFTGNKPAWIQSCWAINNTLAGFNVPQNGIPQPGVISHCRAVNNTPDFTVGTLWQISDNQTI